jgi:hypothetical protein
MVLTHVRSDRVRAGQGRRQSPTRVGRVAPSALAIDAIGRSVPPGKQLCRDFVPFGLGGRSEESGASAAQSQHRVELAYTQQAAHAEERRIAKRDPESERDDLRR